ncbi:hypothetical protein SKAU_G00324830 [Synaphobranchus kaupii]|uniref:Uncharacterized protein n=1 Tax=Synaphobranchus kaupii TaxID=118154 RepID=A0A9Q1IJ69_SYNKA|nr:hypothetical protein SKAU_G00324830 [Synaphobranchus kaupii]
MSTKSEGHPSFSKITHRAQRLMVLNAFIRLQGCQRSRPLPLINVLVCARFTRLSGAAQGITSEIDHGCEFETEVTGQKRRVKLRRTDTTKHSGEDQLNSSICFLLREGTPKKPKWAGPLN